MSQDAMAGQSKRSPHPAYVYGPMVYQFPSDRESEDERDQSTSNQAGKAPVIVLIILLVVVAIVLFIREKGVDLGPLSLKNSSEEDRIYSGANDDYRLPPVITYARVAVGRLYLREGPGTMYVATYLLPKNWGVSLIGDYHRDDYGEVWAKILVQTDDGPQEGWVSRRYLN
jgi:hypothetical protein